MRPIGLLNVAPLRCVPTFRRLWAGSSWQVLGGQIFAFAVLYQMWEMTGSPLMTGTVGLALAAPMVVFGMWGGLLADMRDRRGLILISNIGTAFFALGLTIQAAIGLEEPTLLLALAAANAGCLALGRPARKAMIPDLLPREEVGAGIALNGGFFCALSCCESKPYELRSRQLKR
ncbi:MAG: MFS transporter, partial [Marinosulfonomonas sp.]